MPDLHRIVDVTESVTLSEAAYDLLDARRREGEDFSDVVVRLTRGRSLLNVAGTGHSEDGVAAARDDARESLNRSTERVSEEFREGK